MAGIAGVVVDTNVRVMSPNLLGHYIARMSSDDQAELISGIASGFEAMGTLNALSQLHYVSESVNELTDRRQSTIRWFVAELAAYLDEDDQS